MWVGMLEVRWGNAGSAAVGTVGNCKCIRKVDKSNNLKNKEIINLKFVLNT